MNDDILAERASKGVNSLLRACNGDGRALYRAMVVAENAAKAQDIQLTDELIMEYLPLVQNVEIFDIKRK